VAHAAPRRAETDFLYLLRLAIEISANH
jgi:hypothetical protein